MSTPRTPSRRPSRPGRNHKDDGPRASLRQLLPFVFEQKGVLLVVAILSVLAAAFTLAQPLVVGQLIERVQTSAPLGILIWLLVGLVVVGSVISGIQHFLLQRTGTAVVYSSRRRLVAQLLHLPVQEYDSRRTGDLVSRVGTDTTLLYAVLTQGLADSIEREGRADHRAQRPGDLRGRRGRRCRHRLDPEGSERSAGGRRTVVGAVGAAPGGPLWRRSARAAAGNPGAGAGSR